MTDLAELKRLAEAKRGKGGEAAYEGIAILALIAENERLRAEVDRLGRDESEMLLIAHLDGKHRGKVETERAAFRRGIEAAAKVAEICPHPYGARNPYVNEMQEGIAAAIRAIGEE